MATSKNQKNSSVFIGNIAYHASEAEVKRVCEEIGPIVSFKLMTDKDGKRKGFGFCEYLDEETAQSAIRNLKEVEVRGRTLKVSLADKQGSNLGKNLENHVEDPLTLFLAKYTSDQLIEIVSEMNELGAKNVQEAQRLLKLCPALPNAIVQAQLKLGIVPPHVIHVANIMLGSHSVPQSYTQSRILDHGKFPDTIKTYLGTGPDSGSGIQLLGQVQETQNHREFPTTVNQDTAKRVSDADSITQPSKPLRVKEEVLDSGFDRGSDSITQKSKHLRVKEGVLDSGLDGGSVSDSISHPSKRLRVKEEVFDSAFDNGLDSISHQSKRLRVKEEAFDSAFDVGSGSDSISHSSKRLRVKEEERSEPVEQAPPQVGQVQLSSEVLKVLLEKQMLRLQAENIKATLPPVDQQQQQRQWRETNSSRPPLPIFTN